MKALKGHLIARDGNGSYRAATSDEILQAANTIINSRFCTGKVLTSSIDAQEFLKLRLAHFEHEVFAVLWLDTRHRVIAFEEIFRGTINTTYIFPREIIKSALHHNASACVLAHNHPSGDAKPSRSDHRMTQKVKDALKLIEIEVLDHIIVAENCISLAEQGML